MRKQRVPAGKATAPPAHTITRPLGRMGKSTAPSGLLHLHQTAGNRAVGTLIQAKLRVNEPGDAYEQEADRVADAVLRMPEPVGFASGWGEGMGSPPSPVALRIQRLCPECEDGKMQREVAEEDEEETLQAKPADGGGLTVSPGVEGRISGLRGGGQPLPEAARGFFESRFGYDFGRVRVHADAHAGETARAVNARAFTVGSDVVFGAGEYAPGTGAGRRLLAHELTHVVQQGTGRLFAAAVCRARPHALSRDGESAVEIAGKFATGTVGGTRGHKGRLRPPMAASVDLVHRQSISKGTAPPDKTAVATKNWKAELELCIKQLGSRISELERFQRTITASYLQTVVGQNQMIPETGGQMHAALAYAFINHNPGTFVKTMDKDVVGVDVTQVAEWDKVANVTEWVTEEAGTRLLTQREYFAREYKDFFITGPGTLWFTSTNLAAHEDQWRFFLWTKGGMQKAEVSAILDSWYTRLGNWVSSGFEEGGEAPLLIQFIVDLNPLMGVANLISLAQGKDLYTGKNIKPGAIDWAEAALQLVAGAEEVFGKFLVASLKEAKVAAKTIMMVEMGRKIANPLGYLSEEVVKSWAKDEGVKQILARVMTVILEKVVWSTVEGAGETVEKSREDAEKVKEEFLKDLPKALTPPSSR